MATYRGENVILKVRSNGVLVPYACARECTLSIETDVIETTISGAGNWATFLASKNKWRIDIGGVNSPAESGKYSYQELQLMQMTQTAIYVSMQRNDLAGHTMINEGWAIIISSTDRGSLDDMNIFSVSMQGTGPLTQILTGSSNTGGTVTRYEYTGTGGEFGFTEPLLIGKDLLFADKDGVGRATIITSGSPASKEVLFDAATGYVEFTQQFEQGEIAVLLYQ